MKLPKSILNLINGFKMLPGIGEKTAQRLALYVINQMNDEQVNSLSEALKDVKSNIKKCPICGSFMEQECPICSNKDREQNYIMVVESIKDMMIIEQTENYHGLYHILGGTIDFSKGIEPSDLNIESLLKRITSNQEIILALNGAVDGELTSSYIIELLKNKPIKVSKIAHGIPIGADLSYADKKTLSVALKNRTLLE